MTQLCKELVDSKRVVILDLDGTMVNLEELNYTSFRDATLDTINRKLSYDEYVRFFAGSGSRSGFEKYLNHIGVITDIDTIQKAYRSIKRDALLNRFDSVVTKIDGIDEFLKYCKGRGVKLAVGTSNAKEFAENILIKTGLYPYFDAFVYVEDVENTKPAPDIFLEGLKRVGGTITEAVVFEDSPTGVKAAVNSGMDYVLVFTDGHNNSLVSESKYVISSYFELL